MDAGLQYFYVNALIAGSIVGSLAGMFPLTLGIIKNQLPTGLIGFGVTLFGGALAGAILAIPFAALFVYLVKIAADKKK